MSFTPHLVPLPKGEETMWQLPLLPKYLWITKALSAKLRKHRELCEGLLSFWERNKVRGNALAEKFLNTRAMAF